jgi:hypothetical protein
MEPAEAKSFEIRETTREEQDHLNYISTNGISTYDGKFIGELESKDRDGTKGIYEYHKDDHKVDKFTTANINESYFVSTDRNPKHQKDMLKKYKEALVEQKQRSLNKGGKKTKRRISKRRKTVSNKKNRRA